MKLITKCKHCKKIINLKFSANDRAELARDKGESFIVECTICAFRKLYHVNDIQAKESKWINVFALVILAIGMPIIFFLLKDYLLRPNNPYNVLAIAGLILIPSIVHGLLLKQDRENVMRFNRYIYK